MTEKIWHAEKRFRGDGWIVISDVQLDSGEYVTQTVAWVERWDAKAEEEAYLIAAAPDLYEALEAANKLIAEASMTGFNPKNGDWAERLYFSQQDTSAALAKARGETQ